MDDPSVGRLLPGVPVGVYVHVPFCRVRCPYCDFAVDTRPDIPHDAYADAVSAELRARRPWYDGAGALVSIYFGGGTPGLWRPDALGRVLEVARASFDGPSASDLEITVEANPGEIDLEHLRALRRAGVNRISFGLQSFDDDLLRTLGRTHDSGAAGVAVRAARDAGFDNLCVDLMYGVPGQSMEAWRRAVDGVIALAPEHVSAYALTVERGTTYGSLERAGKLARPGDDEVAAMFEWGRAALADAGLEPYEVSSYARAGRRGRHNTLYWTGGAYLGAGAAAASFRPLDDGTGWRFTNPRSTTTYLRRAQPSGTPMPAQVERRSAVDLENEALWLALRTLDGVDRSAHAARFGRDPAAGRDAEIARCVRAGWLTVTPGRLRLTPSGVLFGDEVAARLWGD